MGLKMPLSPARWCSSRSVGAKKGPFRREAAKVGGTPNGKKGEKRATGNGSAEDRPSADGKKG